MENLSEDELKILLAVARSDDSECDADTLIRTLNLSENQADYYLCLLSFERNYLFWIGNADSDVSDRYRLTNKGRQFLLEGSHI